MLVALRSLSISCIGCGPECSRTVCYIVCVPRIVEYPRIRTIWCEVARAYLGALSVIILSGYYSPPY